MFKVFCFVLIYAWMASPAMAQDPDSSLLESLRTAYQQLDYERTEALAESMLAAYGQYSVEELTEVHTTLALVYFAQNQQVEARRQFEAALSLNDDLQLDPLLVSPKILAFVEDLRSEIQSSTSEEEPVLLVRYVRQEDMRPAAALRSMMVPGLGQMYKNDRRKGVILMGAWGGTIAATGVAHIIRQNARQSYLEARQPADIRSRYDTYNRWNKVRNGLALGVAGVWLYSYFDALITPAALQESESTKTTLTLLPYSEAPYMRLAFEYSF